MNEVIMSAPCIGPADLAVAVTTRPRTAQDEAHLLEVYGSTRAPELAGLGWPDEQVRAFVAMQHAARERSLPEDVDDWVVEVDSMPVGRMIVDGSRSTLRLVDMALLPPFRDQGVGAELLARLCARADAQGRTVELHVLAGNQAARLYQRWGFSFGDRDGLHDQMQRPPGGHE